MRPEITKTACDQSTQLYFIGTTRYDSDHLIHRTLQHFNLMSRLKRCNMSCIGLKISSLYAPDDGSSDQQHLA